MDIVLTIYFIWNLTNIVMNTQVDTQVRIFQRLLL